MLWSAKRTEVRPRKKEREAAVKKLFVSAGRPTLCVIVYLLFSNGFLPGQCRNISSPAGPRSVCNLALSRAARAMKYLERPTC